MESIKNDITGGIIAGVVALPLALAFGIASGLGASAGLWGAIVLGFFAAAFGGTKMQVSGPTGPMSVVCAATVFHFTGDIGTIMSIFVLAGLFQISFGILKLGKLVKFIPYSVVSGFMTGVGFIIIILQLNPMLGVEGVGSTIVAIKSLPTALSNINPTALIIALLTLTILYLTPKKLANIIPPALIALIILTPVCAVFSLDIPLIGDIPTGFPEFIVPSPDLTKIVSIIMYALMLAILGSIDSLLTSLVADSITNTKHNSNQELIGQGIGNALVGFVGGIPGAGATMRTVANIKAGGRGRLSGATHSVFLLLVVLVLAPVVSYVPLSVLAGILIKVGIDILDYRLLKQTSSVSKEDLFVDFTVLLLTVFVNLIFAVGVGIVLAFILYKMTAPKERFEISFLDDEKIAAIKGVVYFGTSSEFIEKLNSINTDFTIDCSNLSFIDISGIYALEDFINSSDKKVTILVSKKANLDGFRTILKDSIKEV
ncbi:MAG: SulP family inorganic anion transporter [Campylobacteraceae bacterium]|nr:SulP family inorganic anion transporter [Campylobacteraceae bacterium]